VKISFGPLKVIKNRFKIFLPIITSPFKISSGIRVSASQNVAKDTDYWRGLWVKISEYT
jgi:hypothetical protein